MTREFTVFMRSEEFGSEEFSYETLDQALEGIRNLFASANGDGVEREIGLRVNKQEE
jgi:hypothetical protein